MFEVNNRISGEDGDWLECPDCLDEGYILLKWFRYCPSCGTSLSISEVEDV